MTDTRLAGPDRFAIALAFVAVVACSVINAAGFGVAKSDNVVITGNARELATQTLACTDGEVPNGQACASAAKKAAEVNQVPAPVVQPRRSDAEVRALIAQTIREHPDLVPSGPAGQTPVIDYDRIIAAVQGRIQLPHDGADAVVDYDKIVTTVLDKLPTPKDGKPGTDGVTPACQTTPAHCQGADGATGPTGPAGQTGPACPPGFMATEHTDLSGTFIRCDQA